MKKLIGVAVIITCLSIAYYFVIFLPSTYHNTAKLPERVIKTSKEDLEMQEKCAKAAKAFFDDQDFTPQEFAMYTCHYYKKENKFFILIKRTIITSSMITTSNTGYTRKVENLWDAFAHKCYGTFVHETYYDGRPETFDFDLLDKFGHSESGWNEAIKPYMED